MSTPTQYEHDAPLWWLIKRKLHPTRTLRDNVVRLRWRRRKAVVVEAGEGAEAAPAPATTPAPEEAAL